MSLKIEWHFLFVGNLIGNKKQTERPHQSNSVLIQPAMDCFLCLCWFKINEDFFNGHTSFVHSNEILDKHLYIPD